MKSRGPMEIQYYVMTCQMATKTLHCVKLSPNIVELVYWYVVKGTWHFKNLFILVKSAVL